MTRPRVLESWRVAPFRRSCGGELVLLASGEFEATARYFAMGALAYHLALFLKRQVLPEGYRAATVAMRCWKVYQLEGIRVCHARGWMLQIQTDVEKGCFLQSARVCRATRRT
jgi:hypothetical protein